MKYFFIALLWTAYCALHSYLISIRFTDLMIRLFKEYYAFYRFLYIVISVILIIPLISISNRLDQEIIITYSFPAELLRNALFYGSLLLFFWAFLFNYDPLSFFGIRQILHFGKKQQTHPAAELKRNGLLGIMRHPMYFALIIFLWCGTFRMADIVTNIVLTIYVIIGTKLEEKKLVLEFGEAYIRYQREVPMLFPFTKPKV